MDDAIQPERDLLLVEREPESRDLGSGLIAPETAKKADAVIAKVLRAGPQALEIYQAGVRILCGPYAGTVFSQEGSPRELLLLPQSEVLAILEDAHAAA